MYIIDWDWWDIGIGCIDLAYTMSLFWFPERRIRFEQSLMRRYYDGLLRHGVTTYSSEACWRDYQLAVIRMLIVPLKQWARRRFPDFWWLHLERWFLAFQDLGCIELLNA